MKNNRHYVPVVLMAGIAFAIAACDGLNSENADRGVGTVTVLGVVVGEEQEKLEQALVPFEEETGIDVVYEGTDAFATLLSIRVDSGNAPDVAMFPQPGLLRDFAQEGSLVSIDEFMNLQDAYAQDWLKLATINDALYGVWYRASVKSLVWYRPQSFEAAGYDIPTTWNELIRLTDQIVQDGGTPWCLGMESGDATGWVGTDWVEDIMLRTAGPDVYDQWITHQIPFTDDRVKAAFEQFGEIALNPDYVVGGYVGVLSTPFGDSPKPLFDSPPGCYLHRQVSFISSFFPETVEIGTDVRIFPFPGIDPEYGMPILVAGDVFAMFTDTPEARALMNYLATPQPHEIWARLGGFISSHQQVELDVYPDEITRQQAKILANADIIRFDGSDMMPGTVGTGTFWTGITDYVGGTDVDEVLENIESSWPND